MMRFALVLGGVAFALADNPCTTAPPAPVPTTEQPCTTVAPATTITTTPATTVTTTPAPTDAPCTTVVQTTVTTTPATTVTTTPAPTGAPCTTVVQTTVTTTPATTVTTTPAPTDAPCTTVVQTTVTTTPAPTDAPCTTVVQTTITTTPAPTDAPCGTVAPSPVTGSGNGKCFANGAENEEYCETRLLDKQTCDSDVRCHWNPQDGSMPRKYDAKETALVQAVAKTESSVPAWAFPFFCVLAMFSFVSFVAVRARRRTSSTRQIHSRQPDVEDGELLLIEEEFE